jgi:putative phosphoribosyl transferase
VGVERPPAHEVAIRTDHITLLGDLATPHGSRAVIVFAHGSGSSRHSPRNRLVAERLQARQLGTLLLDLLTVDEEQRDAQSGALRFDIELLATRLIAAVDWIEAQGLGTPSGIGLFGASTGAAAALVAAARAPRRIGAVVSRGGRPDLADDALPNVNAPTLLIVGQRDPVVLELNRAAARQLPGPHRIDIVPAASHLFEEPGALDIVATLAAEWFVEHLTGAPSATSAT